jgi:hypothetical protein
MTRDLRRRYGPFWLFECPRADENIKVELVWYRREDERPIVLKSVGLLSSGG